MSVEERLVVAVKPFVPTCVHGVYTGEANTYCTYNFLETPDNFGDDAPEVFRCSGQLHLFLPLETNPRTLKRHLWQALLDADLGAASIEDASDETNIHLVFEFEALEEV